MTSPFDLSGRVAIVTGGNGGIGYGMAQGLLVAAASVVIAARDGQKSRAAVAALGNVGPRVVALSVDVSSKPSVEALVERTLEQLGRAATRRRREVAPRVSVVNTRGREG